jgi:hypothetical protein
VWGWSQGDDVNNTSSGCTINTYTSDMRQATSCTVTWGNPPTSTLTETVEIKIDKTAPTITSARPERTADVHGWYNRPVRFDFGGSDSMSGIAQCASVDYAGPDGAAASVSGSCRDVAGNVTGASVSVAYDATGPTIRAVPDRSPDSNGWYTHPVAVAFDGADPVSGVESCTSARYDGPDSGSATVAGSCTDRAGNAATHVAPLPYDATPPSLEVTRVVASKTSPRIQWSASPDAGDVAVTRSPGPDGGAAEVFNGPGRSFTDTGARRRIEYRYRLSAVDPAGHTTTKTVALVPGVGPVLRPGENAGVTKPPLLRWRANAQADYYNVQLHRMAGPPAGRVAASGAGRKIASSWPRSARLKVRRVWRFGGRKERLTPGYYTWHVWPGFGRKGARRYGPLTGTGSFRVVR